MMVRPLLARLVLWLALAPALAGCGAASQGTRPAPPPYTRSADHYRVFADADALAAYLRAGSEAGPLLSAHRGGSLPGYPENAIPTFEHTLRYAPALLEVDVRMSRDSVLVLLHDETLDRTTTGTGPVGAHTLAELRRLLLVDERGIITPYRLPTLAEVLAWAEARAVLTLDVKQDVPPEHLLAAVRRHRAANRVVVIVYSLEDLLAYYRLAPDLVYSASVDTPEALVALVESGVDLGRIIAFTGVGEVHPAVVEGLHAHGIRAILGTFGPLDARAAAAGPEVYQALLARGIDVIATDNIPLATRALRAFTTPEPVNQP